MDKTANSVATTATPTPARTAACARSLMAAATPATVRPEQPARTARLTPSTNATATRVDTPKPFAKTSWAITSVTVRPNTSGRTARFMIGLRRLELDKRSWRRGRILLAITPRIWRCNGSSVLRIIVR